MNEALFSQENPVPTRDRSDGIMHWYVFRRLEETLAFCPAFAWQKARVWPVAIHGMVGMCGGWGRSSRGVDVRGNWRAPNKHAASD